MDIFTSLAQTTVRYGYGVSSSAAAATAGAAIMAMLFVPLIIGFAIAIFTIVCMWKVFKKAGREGWASIVPIYNTIVLLQITELPLWYIALLFIPFAQIYVLIKTNIELAKKFGQGGGFAVLLILLPVIGYAILAFSKDKVYIGGQNTGATGATATPQANQPAMSSQSAAAPQATPAPQPMPQPAAQESSAIPQPAPEAPQEPTVAQPAAETTPEQGPAQGPDAA